MKKYLLLFLSLSPILSHSISATPKNYANNTISFLIQLLPLILLGIIFYFFIIKPQQQRKQKHEEMIRNLKINNKVLTTGGIIGEVEKINSNTIILKTYDGGKIEIIKNAIISQLNESNNN